MARTSKREVIKAIHGLSREDREKVLDMARRLSKSRSHGGHGSLAENDGTPSYLAAAGEEDYRREKKNRERGSWG
jgi:hypothetical protein